MLDTQNSVTPWYRQYWPWYLIGLLLFGVSGTSVLIVEGLRHQDPVVVDNYYKEGLAINQTLDKQRTAATMGLQAQVDYDAATAVLTVRLHARHDVSASALKMMFVHATLANRDYTVQLARQTADVYVAHLKTLQAGTYDVMLEPENGVWRLYTHLSLPVSSWTLQPDI